MGRSIPTQLLVILAGFCDTLARPDAFPPDFGAILSSTRAQSVI